MVDSPTGDHAQIRIHGGSDACRAVLDSLARVATVHKVRGPYRRRSGDGVSMYADVTVRRYASEPGA